MNVQYAVLGDDLYVIEANPRASRTVPFVSKATGIPLAKMACRVMLGEKLAALDLPADPLGDHVAVKEAVMPFDRFAGSDSLLGPEMRSTGEVMGVAPDFPAAFAKAQAAAGARLPRTGTVFLTVTDSDKAGAVGIAAQLHDLGFAIVATRGTAAAISRMGIPVQPLNKIAEGSPHVVDWIERGDVDLVINTPTGTAARTDGYEIRGAATARGIPCITTLSGGMAAARAIAAARHGRPGGRVAAGAPRARLASRCECADRTLAPFGRRLCPVVVARAIGAYDVISVLDAEGPRAGPGAVLHARRERALGRRRRRAAVPPARVLGAAAPRGRAARLPVRGRRPGHAAAVRAARRRRAVAARAAGRRLPRAGGRAAAAARRRRGRDRAAGDLAGRARRAGVLLGFRDAAHAEGAALLRDARVATDDGSVGHHGLVTELLRRGARRRRAWSTPAGRRRCSRRCARCASRASVPAQLALESGMACGYGACFGCVVPTRSGYVRLCVDGPVLDADGPGARRR